ncbi:hypothetical protein FACS189449_03320 [Alphaproteobacteria bacterium]|nr:hypothetical protein FACS189449_03320 [Alphaproteobacteria bacterium]
MKNILAVTACLKRCSIAILYEGVIFEQNLDTDSSANLVSVADALVHENNVDLRKIDGVITASGPGSFTGIRVSHSFVKGVAFSLGIPAISVDYFAVVDSMYNQRCHCAGFLRHSGPTTCVSLNGEGWRCRRDITNGATVTLVLIESDKNHLYFRHYNNGKYNEGVASYENIKSYIRNNNIDVIIGNAGEELGEYHEKMIYIDDFRNAKYLLSFSELLTPESKIAPLYISARSEY